MWRSECISYKSPILQESNQSNSESPKKASIDSNSVPRTLMRSGSIGEQLLNLCQREISYVMSLQLSTSSSRWTSRMSQKCWFCTQAALLVGNLTYLWNIFINVALCWILFSGMVRNSAGVLVPQPNAMESRIRKIVTMHDEDYSRVRKTDYDWK